MKLCRSGTWEVFLLLNLTAYPTKLEHSIVRLRLYQSAFKAIGFWETSRFKLLFSSYSQNPSSRESREQQRQLQSYGNVRDNTPDLFCIENDEIPSDI